MLTCQIKNQLPCVSIGCKRLRAKWGTLCVHCYKQLARTGTTDRTITSRLHSTQLRPVFMLVAASLPQSCVDELAGILMNLPTPSQSAGGLPRQGNVHKLVHARDRATYVLAWITRQHATPELAARAILTRAIAVELMEKPTSAPRYRVASIARSVYRLLEPDKSLVLYG